MKWVGAANDRRPANLARLRANAGKCLPRSKFRVAALRHSDMLHAHARPANTEPVHD